MSLRRVALTEGTDGVDSHVVVGWRKDWLGFVREVHVTMDGEVLAPEPTRPGRPATVFRTADGRMAGVYVVHFPWLGLRPIVWFEGRYAPGTLRTWLVSRRWTAALHVMLIVPQFLAVMSGVFDPRTTPFRAAAAAGVMAGALLLHGIGIVSLWRTTPGRIWAAIAGGVVAIGAARISPGVPGAVIAGVLAFVQCIPVARQIRIQTELLPRKPLPAPDPPSEY